MGSFLFHVSFNPTSTSTPQRTHRHRKTEVEEDAELLKNNEEEDAEDSSLIFTESPSCKQKTSVCLFIRFASELLSFEL